MFEGRKRFEVENMTLCAQDLDEFVTSQEVDRNRLSMAFVGGGQGGGKIAAEFCRLGYPLTAYNTCKEDLDDLESMIQTMEGRGPFIRIDLEGQGGASKDRDLGLKAIADNGPLIKERLLSNDYIYDADFVWICVALGGGTGNGSLTSVSKLVSYVRQDKAVYRGGNYKPTVGIIAAIPDQTAKSKIRVNVAKALEEIELLHEEGAIGSVILVDNQKLIDDFNASYENDNMDEEKTWATDGNNRVARVITELALTTSLKSGEMLDKAEMLDIWATPGFMSIGKKVLEDAWIVDACVESKVEDIPTELEKKRTIFGEMVKRSFSESVFVEGIDLETALHGGMTVISDGKIISSGDSKTLEYVLNERVLNSDTIEAPHFGFIRTKLTGTVKEKAVDNKSQGRVFTMCVTKGAPAYIVKWFEDTIESRKKHYQAMEKVNAKSGLQGLTNEISSKSVELKQNGRKEISLDSLFNGVKDIEIANQNRKKNLDALDDIFGGMTGGFVSPKKQENTREKQDEMLAQIMGKKVNK